MKTYINDLQPGPVSLLAAVQQREVKESRGKQRLVMTLADKTGTVDAVLWDAYGVDHIQAGSIIELSGVLGTYNDKPQLTVDGMGVTVIDATCVDLADFLPSTTHDIEDLYGKLLGFVDALIDPTIKDFLLAIVTDPEIASRLRQAPAAMKVHHAYVGGLLEHVVSMLGVAWRVANHYKRLNRDLLAAGVVLHDIGKIDELSVGVTFGYTKVGSLVGHIPLGYALVEKFAAQTGLPEETKLLLQHLILSHHGQREHGAVQLPSTPEAIALSCIDGLDAKLNTVWAAIDDAPTSDEFTAYIPSLQRRLYRGAVAEETADVVA